jgi:hypothetical protein
MPIQDAVKPVQKVTTSELSKDFADHLAIVAWGTPGAEANDKIAVTLQLKNALGDDLVAKERIRLTCTEGATMNIANAGDGTVLSGADSADIIIETVEASGQFDLEVTYAQAGTVTVVGGATQGSGFVNCSESIDLTFAGA